MPNPAAIAPPASRRGAEETVRPRPGSAEKHWPAKRPARDKPTGAGHAGSFLARVRRHLALLIVAKIAFLALLYVLFFSASQRPDVTPERVDRLLFPTG